MNDKFLAMHVHYVNMWHMLNDVSSKMDYRLFKIISENSEISQRKLALELGLSLGKTNYCLKAFIARGLVKVNNFRRSDNKMAYSYLLTPKGLEEKARVTLRFFNRVEEEYEMLREEVESMFDINEQKGATIKLADVRDNKCVNLESSGSEDK